MFKGTPFPHQKYLGERRCQGIPHDYTPDRLLTPTGLPSRLRGLYWTGLTPLNDFHFLVYLFIYFGSCGRLKRAYLPAFEGTLT